MASVTHDERRSAVATEDQSGQKMLAAMGTVERHPVPVPGHRGVNLAFLVLGARVIYVSKSWKADNGRCSTAPPARHRTTLSGRFVLGKFCRVQAAATRGSLSK